jgi:hypothetical protein
MLMRFGRWLVFDWTGLDGAWQGFGGIFRKRKIGILCFFWTWRAWCLAVYHGGENNRGIMTPSLGLSGLDTLDKKVLIGWAHILTEYYEARAFC